MEVTRSKFLLTLATGVGAALALPSSGFAAQLLDKPVEPTLPGFRKLVGSVFRVEGPSGPADLVLVAIVERTFGKPGGRDKTHQYSLEFRAASGEPPLDEGTYVVEENRLGVVSLFVSPTRQDASGGRFYRADFNQLV